ncbi:hypothetical protein BC828DRAFT_385536 [Blastocladiella britannica]|nr:hypothetical protein BC828DRAFT_385536 [Blastocladiella britannica]
MDMLASIKNTIKSFGGAQVDERLRPAVHKRATEELTNLRTRLIADLPDTLERHLLVAAKHFVDHDDGEGFSQVAATFIRKQLVEHPRGPERIKNMVDKVRNNLGPVVMRATDRLDERATEAAMRELKGTLHLNPSAENASAAATGAEKPPKARGLNGEDDIDSEDNPEFGDLNRALNAEPPVDPATLDPALMRDIERSWPKLPAEDLASEKIAAKVSLRARALVRQLTIKMLPMVVVAIPDELERAVNVLMDEYVDEQFDSLRDAPWSGKWLDKLFTKAERKVEDMQRALVDDFMDGMWHNGVRPGVVDKAVTLTVKFEDSVRVFSFFFFGLRQYARH